MIRYIQAHEVERYRADGWTVTLMLGHHGHREHKPRYIAVKDE